MIDLKDKKILIIKLRYIGDTLSIVPVIENLKFNAPDATVDVMVQKGTEDVIRYHPDINKVIIYDRNEARQGIFSTLTYYRKLVSKMRSVKYDYILDFTLGDRAAVVSFLSGAPERITYREASTLSHILMTHIVEADPFKSHIVDHQLKALEYFGITTFNRSMSIHEPPEVEAKVSGLLKDSGIEKDSWCIAIHPGARGKLRQWRSERFAQIIDRIKNKYNASILLIGGPDERTVLDDVERAVTTQLSLRSTDLTLLEMASLLKKCRLFIGNDSAPGHIAAAAGCSTLSVFGPTFPHMWSPLAQKGEVIFKDVPCCGCKQLACIRPDDICMDMILVDEVWEKVETLLKSCELK